MDKQIQSTVELIASFEKKLATIEEENVRLQAEIISLRQLYERAPLSYQSLDENGCFLSVNQAWLDTLGYRHDEVIGQDFGSFLHPDWRDHFKENFPRFKAVGEILGVEFEMRKKDGSFVFVSFNGKIGKDPQGNFQQTYCLFQDITRQKQAEAALVHSEEKWRNIIVSTPQIGISLDPQGRIVFANAHFLQLVGWTEQDIIGQDWFEMFIPSFVRDEVQKVFLMVMGQEDVLEFSNYENEIVTRTGDLRNVAWSNCISKDTHGNITDVTCLGIDLTERKRAEAAIRESEERSALALRGTSDGLWDWNVATDKIYFSERWMEIIGYAPGELKHEYAEWANRVHPEDFDRVIKVNTQCLQGVVPSFQVEYRMNHKDGTYRWILGRGSSLRNDSGKIVRMSGAHTDITERKQAEEALKLIAESSLLSANDIIPFLVRQIAVSQGMRYAMIARIDSHDLSTAHTLSVWSGDRYGENFSYALEGTPCSDVVSKGTTCYSSNIQALFPQDRLLVEMGAESYWGTPLRNSTGEVLGVMAVIHDRPIVETPQTLALLQTFALRTSAEMERLQTEEALRESEDRFKALHNASFGGIAIHDRGKILDCNQGLSEITGYSFDELLSMEGLLLISEKSRGMVLQNILSGYQKPYEIIGVRKNNEEYPLRLEARNIRYKGKNVRVTEFRDISEQRQKEEENIQLESKLRQAQKMEAIGQLAGGVAHDFNNMLGVITGYSEMILEETDPSQPLYNELQEIRKAAARSTDLTRQLLTFARKQTVTPQILDLNQIIEGMLNLLRRLIGENINIIWMPGTSLWPINMDPSQIDQILANLCVNARDAIADVGKMTIETENAILDEKYCNAHAGFVTGEYVRITVSDTGKGMDQEMLAHIFEPFFTTKGIGEGTGLGLATVYGAVKQNNGFINAYSEPGQGATFTIFIPRHIETTGVTRTKASAKPIFRGDEVILLVEDEPTILDMTKMMLERLGYTILSAGTPREAIRLAGEYSGEIHLLATDVIMPEMNGHQLSERLVKSRPEMKCLFMSGYTADIMTNQGMLKDGVSFIAKPFSSNGLAVKVRETLES